MRRHVLGFAIFVLALAGTGCTSFGSAAEDMPGSDAAADAPTGFGDAGAEGGGGTIDGSPGPLQDAGSEPEPSDVNGLTARPGTGAYDPSTGSFDGESGGDDAPTACYDGIDNGGEAAIDCADASCHVLRSCCVGSGDCCAPATSPLAAAVDPSAAGLCDGAGPLDAASCLVSGGFAATAFGDPAPAVEGAALYPSGNANGDSGLLLGTPADLGTHRLAVDVTFGAPTGCGTSCLEGIGVGFTTQTDLPAAGDEAHVRPVVALLLSGSRSEVSLVVADELVRSWPYEAGAWRLVARPTGEVTVAHDGTPMPGSARFVPPREARLVLWGRNRSTTTETRAHVTRLAVERELCDIPSAWGERRALALRDPGSGEAVELTGALGAPSLAVEPEGGAWLAFDAPAEDGGRAIHVAERAAGAALHDFTLRPPPAMDATTPALAPGGLHDAASMQDPELLRVETAGETTRVLFYTAVDEDGTASIGRAVQRPSGEGWQVDDAPVLDPALLDGVRSVTEPTVLRRDGDNWIMVARVEVADGVRELRLYRSDDTAMGTSWERVFSSSELDEMARNPGQRAPAYDADEIASPSLVIHDGAWQLYYARRRGTRWSVGLLASHELLYWRHVDDGAAVLAAGTASFDRLGVRAPDGIGSGDGVELVHVGIGGSGSALGIARRKAADDGAF